MTERGVTERNVTEKSAIEVSASASESSVRIFQRHRKVKRL